MPDIHNMLRFKKLFHGSDPAIFQLYAKDARLQPKMIVGKIAGKIKHELIDANRKGLPPKYAVSNVVGYIKGKSAITIARKYGGRSRNFTGEVFWARGHFVSTVGLDEAMVRAYKEALKQLTDTGSTKRIAAILRQTLLELSLARQSSEGQQTKTEMVYQYLTGSRFRQRVEAIVEAFSSMQEDLDKERKAIMKQWAKREEQIERVMGATVGMYGDLQGIAGKSLQEIDGLELNTLGLERDTTSGLDNL